MLLSQKITFSRFACLCFIWNTTKHLLKIQHFFKKNSQEQRKNIFHHILFAFLHNTATCLHDYLNEYLNSAFLAKNNCFFPRNHHVVKRLRLISFKTISHAKNKAFIYGLLTKHEIKMAGYWPGSFLACLWTVTEWLLGNFFLQDTAGSPERAR